MSLRHPTIKNLGPCTILAIPVKKDRFILSPPYEFSMLFDGNDAELQSLPMCYNGKPLIDNSPYNPYHPRSCSLERCTNDDTAESIEFYAMGEFDFPIKRKRSELILIALYHSHVLWSYGIRIEREDDGKYSVSLTSIGPHMSYEEDEEDEDTELKNEVIGQKPPPIDRVLLQFFDIAGTEFVERDRFVLEPSENGNFSFAGRFTQEELRELAVNDKLIFGINYYLARSYFSLASIIDLEATPTVSPGTLAVVVSILRGERPTGCDWKITGGLPNAGDSSSTFYVHKAAFAKTCPSVKAGLLTRSLTKGLRCSLDNEGLKTAIRIAYGIDVPLPYRLDRKNYAELRNLFQDHFAKVVAPQWERAICRTALALDTRNPSSSSMASLLHLLHVIWESPIGWMPVAKRVAIGVMADMVLPSFNESGIPPDHLPSILRSLTLHIRSVSKVIRTAFAKEKSVKEAEEEGVEQGGDIGYVEVPNENTCSCTIL